MADIYNIHSQNPEGRKINQVVQGLREGGVLLYPTDTGFTLGCELGNKNAIEKLRRIRKISDKKSLTFLCNGLSNISDYARISNLAYRTIKRLIPGPYTFILPATKLVPTLALNPLRKTAGIRVPDNVIAQSLIEAMEMPIISISAKIDTEDEDDFIYLQPDEIIDKFTRLVDIVISTDDYDFQGESTVIDMVTDEFKIIREGAGFENINF
ncbi:MAG: threonylcarbamoyl-AMP synthase [Ignavibacteria bacterium]|jgi:tRNA threonylcarbamoyl adenosine modification protein (Sua5/YciO/YrdC/YwlC family)|nr:threonylcarbamoyl-AMP synthase [Ignavibacteria bacterium]